MKKDPSPQFHNPKENKGGALQALIRKCANAELKYFTQNFIFLCMIINVNNFTLSVKAPSLYY